MLKQQRDPLIGQFFIVRATDGRPMKAGRIRSRTLDGEYEVTVYGTGTPRGEVATSAQMATDKWELYLNETNWRRAFAPCQ